MKLVQEFNIKIIVFILSFVILMEIGILSFLLYSSRSFFNDTYNQTMKNSKQKTIEITRKIQTFVKSLLLKQSTDLKLICKHASLLNGKRTYYTNNIINKNSNFIINSNKSKQIIYAKTEKLVEDKYLQKYFNKSTYFFDYYYFYEKEFQNVTDQNLILNNLLSDSHQELNKISYYSLTNNEVKQNLSIKFIISILKTIYIRRYLAKRGNNDYIRFIILNKEEMYIYPPEAYNSTLLYYFYITHQPQTNTTDITQKFPLNSYIFFYNRINNRDYNYILFYFELILFENVYVTLCMKISLEENNPNQAFICLEIDFTKFLNEINFNNPENLDFGILYYDSNSNSSYLVPLIYSRKNIYEDIKNVFNDTVSEHYIIDENKSTNYDLFHFLYYNLTKISKEHPELNVNFTEIEEEYNVTRNKIIKELIEYDKTREVEKIEITFTKTICRKKYIYNEFECVQDEFEIIIIPILFDVINLNENYMETGEDIGTNFNMYIFSILSTNPASNKLKIGIILNLKLMRTVALFFFSTIILISFFLLIINLISQYFLKPTNEIIRELKNNTNNFNSQKCQFNDVQISTPNKEMIEIKYIFDIMKKSFIIKQVFEKENYLENNNLEFLNLIQDIQNKNVKEICNSFLGFYHFKHNSYSLAESEFRSTLLYIKDNENKLISGKNKEYEDKIKDEIKRSSTVSYINEYSKFEGIDEILSHIINLKIFKQRFLYLYGMTKFKLGTEINPNNLTPGTNKAKIKKEKEKKINYFKDSIKYFNKCKNINISLGINQIKIIYSLIMISKCYIQLNEYKNAIININEALTLFFEFSKTFKDYHSKNYNPRFMLFIENYVFQYILFTMQRICNAFNKPFASNWINLKIFETSPFIINDVHYYSGIFLQNYLDKNKLKINRLDYKFLLKEYDKAKKYFSKIIPRMNVKNMNSRKKRIVSEQYANDSASYSTSIRIKTESKTDKSMFSSTFKRELATGKISSLYYFKNKNLNKIITLCLSEKVLKNVNGLELKDIIIKYFQKYFIMNENDKFNFIQFSNNGKKTIHLKMEPLDYFILKIQKTKSSFELTESFEQNKDLPFMELFNLFDSIFRSYPSQDDIITDNIILMIINTDDIRFSSISECLKIVDELNKRNASLFILTYDVEISNQKVNNIHSFLNGLFEGYFFQIKSYQQLKQIFINISTVKSQSNFFGYDYEGLDYLL